MTRTPKRYRLLRMGKKCARKVPGRQTRQNGPNARRRHGRGWKRNWQRCAKRRGPRTLLYCDGWPRGRRAASRRRGQGRGRHPGTPRQRWWRGRRRFPAFRRRGQGRGRRPGTFQRRGRNPLLRPPRTLPYCDGWPRGRTIGRRLRGRGVNRPFNRSGGEAVAVVLHSGGEAVAVALFDGRSRRRRHRSHLPCCIPAARP